MLFLRSVGVASLLATSSLAAAEAREAVGTIEQVSTTMPVIGGATVPAGKWPDAVAVIGPQGACTGTLIAPDIVLTAGHCADAGLTTVIANTTNYNGTGGTRSAIKTITAHPSWETTFDVSVIVLQTPITTVTPRPLGAACTFQSFNDNMMVHLVGFGLTDTAGMGNNTVLREATAPVTDADCSGAGGCAAGARPAGEFIAGGGGTDSCFGDSGGPVYLDTPRGTVVIAAVSRGLDNSATPCGGGGIYVRTDKVLAWIEQTAGHAVTKDSCASGSADPDDPGAGGDGDGTPTGPDKDGTSDYTPSEVTGGCSTSAPGASAWLGLALVAMIKSRRSRRPSRR